MKQIPKTQRPAPLPESYLLCRDCDGTWVDSAHGDCEHCRRDTTSRDFHLCLACAMREKRCQHCAEQIEVNITTC